MERITRIGDSLRWEATVEEPNVLTKPWLIFYTTSAEVVHSRLVAILKTA